MKKLLFLSTLVLAISVNAGAQVIVNNINPDFNEVLNAQPTTNGNDYIIQPILETGKRWVFKNYYRSDPNLPHPVPYYELLIGEKIQENGRDMYVTYIRNAGETEFTRSGNRYEENGILYVFDPDKGIYVPMIDMTLPVGYVLPNTYTSIAKKRRTTIEGKERLVVELVDDYVNKPYYWIEGIGSLPNLYISDFEVIISEASEMIACYMGEECIFDSGTFMAEVSAPIDIKPITRTDRIWECISNDGEYLTVKYMKFDGTEEFDNKQFHRIVTCAKGITRSQSDLKNAEFKYSEYLNEPEGYMREEDGKVYTWLMGDYSDNCFYGSIYIPGVSYPNNYAYSEKLIYDFKSNPGDCFGAFSGISDFGAFTGFDIISKSTVTVGNEECSLIELCPTEARADYPSYTIVEGIGPIDSGCLAYSEYLKPSANTVYRNHFNRLFDNNGNVLYENPSGCIDFKLPENLFSSVVTIKENNDIQISDYTISFGENGNHNEVFIYDMSGRIVKSVQADTQLTISTANITPGVYICTGYCNGNQIARCKFTVK